MTLPLIGGLAGVALGIAASLASAAVFGFYAARKAARLNPVEALRFE